MTAYRVVAEQDDESLVVFETLHFNQLASASYHFWHNRYGQEGATILLQQWVPAFKSDFDTLGDGGHWQTVDWKDQEEN